MKKALFTIMLLLCAATLAAQPPVSIIPRPQQVEMKDGSYEITPRTTIVCNGRFEAQARLLQEALAAPTGWDLSVKHGNKGGIVLRHDSSLPSEGYQLEVGKKGIAITAADPAGAFYGTQTLLQLLPPEAASPLRKPNMRWTVPAISVADAPAQPWRGMMLDVARYFYGPEFVKGFIDKMAAYKLNKLQLHLIDDSGWRLEIKKYPLLTEVGAWSGPEKNRLGGYYTQDEMRQIISYAEERGVEIIPEVEFPAHFLSAIAAYPRLSCTGQQHEVPTRHFISEDLLCVGNDSALAFLDNVLDEVAALFPSSYLNIGGDEAVYKRWEQCPRCQAVMKREGLKEASELQGYLTRRVARRMSPQGRTLVGWEEIMMRGEVPTPVVAVIWHNTADSIKATQAGHKAVLAPVTHAYLDMPESSTPGEVKAATWMPPISLEKCYSLQASDYSPQSTVLGVQGCFWSDQFILGDKLQEIAAIDENRSERYAEYLCFPRMLAISEVGWTRKALRNYADFSERIARHYRRLDAMGCAYRVPEPVAQVEPAAADGTRRATLKCPVEGAEIRYTTNGTLPNTHSPRYEGGTISLAPGSTLRAITVVTPTHYSLPATIAAE